MFKEAIERLVANGEARMKDLQCSISNQADEAKREVARVSRDVGAIVKMAHDIPEKAFERFSHIMVTEFQIHQLRQAWFALRVPEGDFQLRGFLGHESLTEGKYRAVVMLERIAD